MFSLRSRYPSRSDLLRVLNHSGPCLPRPTLRRPTSQKPPVTLQCTFTRPYTYYFRPTPPKRVGTSTNLYRTVRPIQSLLDLLNFVVHSQSNLLGILRKVRPLGYKIVPTSIPDTPRFVYVLTFKFPRTLTRLKLIFLTF